MIGTVSVIIPTYNRCETLEKSLAAYMAQSALRNIAEILVVDDGSTDATKSVVTRLAKASTIPIRYLAQENKGPAAARNCGIREATSPLILFTDDDILPGPALVAEHLEWHARFPDLTVAVLGTVTWSPEVLATPFMRWYGSDGPLFAYAHFAGRTELEYTDFYTCNLSLKTEFLRGYGMFDEEFKAAAFEDIELGYRLKKAGLRLMYNTRALAFHRQHFSFDDACRRARKVAEADEVFRRTEAGAYFYSRRRGKSPLRSFLRNYRSPLESLRRQLGLVLSPLKNIMDCRLPLPWSVYRAMFRIYR